ncbi:hypothetical protein PMSD_13465 [Paenibacillus macquariensis subsp. defensor]|nr:hypothetical protein PMSD_13465 [Paenibacillus macquariensis subsp. defensor]
MRSNIAQGWKSLKNQFYVVIILFLYHLLFGYFLYRLVNSAVVPLLQRYPDPPPTELSQILFYIEGQLDLTHSSTVHSYLWILLGMLLFRMFITPFIHSGIFYGLHQERKGETGAFFFQGMRRCWKRVMLCYWIETLFVLAPAYWLLPKLYTIAMNGFMSPSTLIQAIPWIVGWFLYRYVIHQIILYMQFGITDDESIFSSTWICLRHVLSVIGISLILGALSLLLFCLFTGLSLFWTGILALILQQAYPLITCLFKMWNITSQFNVWATKLSKNKK